MSLNLIIFVGAACTALSICSGTLFLHERKAEHHNRAFWLKGAGSFFFLLTGVFMAVYTERTEAVLVAAGLFCGLLGDLLLGIRNIFPAHKKICFYTGGLAFSIGHLFYIAALWNRDGSLTKFTAICFLLLITGAVVYGQRKEAISSGRLIPSTIYISFVAVVSAMAMSSFWYYPETGSFLFALGGLSFFISDNLLGAYTFGKDQSAKLNIWLHVTYYGAQILIGWSSLFL